MFAVEPEKVEARTGAASVPCTAGSSPRSRASFGSGRMAEAWTADSGPRELFDGSVRWLHERLVLLPGVTALTRLVA